MHNGSMKTCYYCGSEIIKTKHCHKNVCLSCSQPTENKYIQQNKANSLVSRFPDRVVILYECNCNNDEKEKHHPDYFFPYFICKLCKKCHKAEHRRMRKNGISSFQISKLTLSTATPQRACAKYDEATREASEGG